MQRSTVGMHALGPLLLSCSVAAALVSTCLPPLPLHSAGPRCHAPAVQRLEAQV